MARRVTQILNVEENIPILLWVWTRGGKRSSKKFSLFIKKCKINITNSWFDILEFKDPFTGKKAKIKKKKYGGYERLDLSKPETGFGIKGFEGFTNRKKRVKVAKNDKPREEGLTIFDEMRIGAAIANPNGIARVDFANIVPYQHPPPLRSPKTLQNIRDRLAGYFIEEVATQEEVQAQLGQKPGGGDANVTAMIDRIQGTLKDTLKNYIGQQGPSHVKVNTAVTLPKPTEMLEMDIKVME